MNWKGNIRASKELKKADKTTRKNLEIRWASERNLRNREKRVEKTSLVRRRKRKEI